MLAVVLAHSLSKFGTVVRLSALHSQIEGHPLGSRSKYQWYGAYRDTLSRCVRQKKGDAILVCLLVQGYYAEHSGSHQLSV